MTIDLWMLVATAALQWALIMAVATPNLLLKGLSWGFGNRDEDAEAKLPSWLPRMQRANQNLAENLPIFAVLVLVVHLSGHANATTALGAEIFFGARLLHPVIYVIGIPVVRTLVWTVSIVGMVMIATAL
ncbi:MAG: MAPEG family protein [Myxococcales bacterium]|nr:MAPEG family protein [Myxococcales bacterium]